MKRTHSLLLAIGIPFLTGCQNSFNDAPSSHTGNNGGSTAGPMGPAGPAGPAGAPGPGIAWVDATGVRAEGVMPHPGGGSMLYLDPEGRVWAVDPENATLDVFAADLPVRWSDLGCTGAAFVRAPLPRFTFRIADDQAVRVRHDTMVAFDVTVRSQSLAEGGCEDLLQEETERAIALPAEEGIEIPVLDLVAPLHPELPPAE